MARVFLMVTLLVGLVAVSSVLGAPPKVQYTDRYDTVNIDSILNNGRILNNYIKCLLGKGACTAEGRELKSTLPDALASDCSKCSPRQKEAAQKVIDFLMKKRPNDWAKLEKEYDPSGAYRKRFETLQKQGQV